MTTRAQPSQCWECIPCQETYFAGAHAGAGPFFCEFCLLELTLRPGGAEPYAGGAVEPAAPAVNLAAQMEWSL